MPGESHSDAPAAVPMQVAVQSLAPGSANGHPDQGGNQPKPMSCLECKKTATIVCGGCWQAGYCARDHQLTGWVKHRPRCRPWRTAYSQVLGRHMIATRDVAAGELLLQDPPLLLGPKNITEPVCLGCYRPVDGSYVCRTCHFPMCGPECEGSDDHEPECKAVKDSGVSVKVTVFGEINSMYECITPLRILNLRDAQPMVWNKMQSLESNLDKRGGTEVAAITQQTVVDIIHDRLNLEDEYDAELIQRVLGIIDTNAFEIRLPDSSIQGIYESAALLEHNCVANTHRTFDADLNLVVRAAVPIKRGQHLSSCYTDPITTTFTRQDHLRSSKYFTCQCDRCLDPTELGTFLSALRCSDCTAKIAEEKANAKKAAKAEKEKQPPGKTIRGARRGGVMNRITQFQTGGGGRGAAARSQEADGAEGSDEPRPWIVPEDPCSPSSNWKCLHCGHASTDDYPSKITDVVVEESEDLENAPTIATCEAFIKKWEHIFHPDHAIFQNIKYILLHLYGSEEGYELESLSPIDLARKEELCRTVLRVADILLPGITRLRGSVLYELYQSLFYKARALFSVGAISNDQARRMASSAMTYLKECVRVLTYEPEVQPEGQLGLEAKEEIKQLEEWIKDEGWKL